MKITRRQLKRIIQEELAQVLQEFDPQLAPPTPSGAPPGPSDPSLYGAEIGATAEEEESIMRDLAKRREEEAQMRGLRGPEREEYWNKRLGGPYIG